MGYSGFYHQILAVDMEGETWRKIPCPRRSEGSIHQSQGHLCVCAVRGCDMPKLNIWILEDYGTNKWTLKHTISTLDMFTETNIEFGYWDVDQYYSTVHPEWNLLLFVGLGTKMTSSHITWTAEKFMSSLYVTVHFLDGMFCHKTSIDLTIFPMFPCSRNWSH